MKKKKKERKKERKEKKRKEKKEKRKETNKQRESMVSSSFIYQEAIKSTIHHISCHI